MSRKLKNVSSRNLFDATSLLFLSLILPSTTISFFLFGLLFWTCSLPSALLSFVSLRSHVNGFCMIPRHFQIKCSCGSRIASCNTMRNMRNDHLDPARVAVIVCNGSATHPWKSTLRWCSKFPQRSVSEGTEAHRPCPSPSPHHLVLHFACSTEVHRLYFSFPEAHPRLFFLVLRCFLPWRPTTLCLSPCRGSFNHTKHQVCVGSIANGLPLFT